MIRAVLDTNVLVSGFVNRLGPSGQILLIWEAAGFTLIVSEEILIELDDVLNRPYFLARLQEAAVDGFLDLLRTEALVISPDPSISGACPDPDDDVVLATAVAGHAAYLVTGDKDLQSVGAAGGVTIASPRDFLTLLTSPQEGDDNVH